MKKECYKGIIKQVFALVLTLAVILSGIMVSPSTADAAGWLDYAGQTITLGTAVSASIKDGDYYGAVNKVEACSGNGTPSAYYWHIYKFSMPQQGLLNIYLESASDRYLYYYTYTAGSGVSLFSIYSASNPDNVIWVSKQGQNAIKREYSASRDMYYGSTEIALEEGEYYFAVRQHKTNDTPYYLTLSYKEPVINVSSISLSPSSLSMEIGAQKTIIPTVLPSNATDPTVVWKSANPLIATVEDGIVTAVASGTTSVTATSADGEIKATCPVTVMCSHTYESSISPAGIDSKGYILNTCTKCGTEEKEWIAAIDSMELSETEYQYDGKEHKPSVTVRDNDGNTLKEGKDYVVSYPENTKEIDTYTVTVDFQGDYEGSAELEFTVFPIYVESVSLDMGDITMEIGAQQNMIATVLPGNATDQSILWSSSDPSVLTVDDNGLVKALSVGTAVVTATTVDGEETASCTIEVACAHVYRTRLVTAATNRNGLLTEECSRCGKKRQNTTIYAISDMSLSLNSCAYNGRTQTPATIVRDTQGKILKYKTDYTISYTGNRKDVGVHTVTVKFRGNYSGSLSRQFTIYPASTVLTKVKAKRKGFTANWKKQRTQTTGYELAYSTTPGFKNNKTTVAALSRNKAKKTISKLKKKKRYYIRIRTYKTVKVNGQSTKLYSGWSATKTVMTK